jgi:hypothetical protein
MIESIKDLARIMGVPYRHSPGSSLDQCHRLFELGFSVWCDDLSLIDENSRGIVQDSARYLDVNRGTAKREDEVDDFMRSRS